MRDVPELSVVILCYGAGEQLGDVVGPLYDELEAADVWYELVLVANYWPRNGDRTPEYAKAFAQDRPEVSVVAQPKAGAMGWDLRSGLELTTGSVLVYLDGDGQVRPHDALEVYRRLQETGAAVVKGRRYIREDGSVRTLTSLVYNLLFRLLFKTAPLWDINGQPKGLTREAYEHLNLQTDDWFTDAEIVLKARAAGMKMVEVPVRFLPRRNDRSSLVGTETVWEFLVNMARWRLGRHPALTAPMAPRRPREIARTRR